MADHPGNGMHEPPSAEDTTVPSSASGGDAEGQPSANAASDLSNQQNVSQESTPPLPDTSDTDATAFATPQSQGENKTEVKADEAGHVHSPAEVRPERPASPEIRVNGGKSAETSDPLSSSTSPQQPVPEVGASTADNVTTALDAPSSGASNGRRSSRCNGRTAAPVSQPGALERSLSDTELCASNAVKGIDLDAVFAKSLDSVAVPVGQAAAENDIAKRPHHHKGAMMRSRTVSVVSLIADLQAVVTRKESYLTLLRVPQVIVVSVILVIGSQSQGFVEPTLEPHMRKDQRIPIMIVGLIIMSAAQLFMGPAPFLGLPSEVIGPSAGGVLLDIIGFPWASTVVAAGSLLTALMATLYWCCASRVEPESYWHRGAASSSDSSDDDSDSAVSEPAGETTALLGKKRKDFHYSSL
ncbi:hypothetical protein HPB48_007489 [Haemaphysalis longicornis]|uniref:Uncharacterized protein n=1 Tax=Haemaphysalis longicornis TaxID=44386 RepID=A0A9J6GEE2_HAELO|nr:hypothetical protein HPB48_007489 [Haemaphysalis longicornis]